VRVRTRLILAFGYILVVVVVALEVPLALNLQKRALAEQESQELILAQAMASHLGGFARAAPAERRRLAEFVAQEAARNRSRIIVVDAAGLLVVDSAGPAMVGRRYATAGRPELVEALRDGRPASRRGFSETLRQEIQAVAVPILSQGRVLGAVRVSQGTSQVGASVRRTMLGLVAVGLAGLLAGLLIAFVLAGSLGRPLSRLATVARRLGSGDLSARAGGIRGPREVEDVARSFDDMADRLEATLRAQREFAANASHQLRTPLTGLKLRLESALAAAPEEADDLRRQLGAADHEADRLGGIVERLMVLARRAEGRPGEVDLADAAGRAAARFRAEAERSGWTVEVAEPDRRPLAQADAADVDQILDALVDNAIAHAPGPVRIESGGAEGVAFLAVEDRGPGIPGDEVPRVTERFYRGRESRPGGSGLGLAIVRELAERSGGEVSITSVEGGGTRVEVRLPATGPARGRLESPAESFTSS
jgi:two-component system, OmpR family, sensor kinase